MPRSEFPFIGLIAGCLAPCMCLSYSCIVCSCFVSVIICGFSEFFESKDTCKHVDDTFQNPKKLCNPRFQHWNPTLCKTLTKALLFPVFACFFVFPRAGEEPRCSMWSMQTLLWWATASDHWDSFFWPLSCLDFIFYLFGVRLAKLPRQPALQPLCGPAGLEYMCLLPQPP